MIERYASPTTQVGAMTAFFGGLSANEVAAYGGLLVGFLGLVMNWYYKAKADRREELRLRDELTRKD